MFWKCLLSFKFLIFLIKSFDVNHGQINATGYVMEKIAYLSDCNDIPQKNLIYLNYDTKILKRRLEFYDIKGCNNLFDYILINI